MFLYIYTTSEKPVNGITILYK